MKGDFNLILWSGGKDSYLSYRKAVSRAFRITGAVSYVEEKNRRLIGCYVREGVIRKQLEALGLEFYPVYGSKRKGNFLRELSKLLEELRPSCLIMGDVRRREHRNLIENLCSKLGIRTLFPLWWMDAKVLLAESLKLCEPIVVCRKTRVIDRKFLGRAIDRKFVSYLEARGLSPDGEGGEYQTFVRRCREFELNLKVERNFRRSYYECIDFRVERG